MKKLIIAAVAVAFAAVSQAASVNWTATAASTTLSGGGVANGVAAYLFEGTLSEATIQSIADGTWTGAGALAQVQTAANGSVMKTGVGSYANQTVDFSMILLNAADYASATEFKYAEVKDVVFVTANKPVAFATPLTSASWQAINVPEPTSGLMLLLGMAGLALRRRRA